MDKPIVSILMGSDSDMPVLKETIATLSEFEIPFEVQIMSAHRSPEKTSDYAKNAKEKGIKVIIAAAGGAAHLAGVVASHTILPVIGVPIKGSTLDGLDSLLSIVQMPPGVPVATVGINAAKNAALLAIQILATSDVILQPKLVDFKRKMILIIEEKNKELKK